MQRSSDYIAGEICRDRDRIAEALGIALRGQRGIGRDGAVEVRQTRWARWSRRARGGDSGAGAPVERLVNGCDKFIDTSAVVVVQVEGTLLGLDRSS